MLDYYFDSNTIAELQERYQRDDIDSIVKIYSEDGNSIDEIMDQYEVLRNPKKSSPEETIAERVNYYLLKSKNKENRNWNQNLDSKKAFTQICIVIGTIISCY